jgi:SecD/SecF fusion protein
MQNKGAIKLLAILFALVSIYQLSFSYFTSRTERKAREYANSERFVNEAKALSQKLGRSEEYYLDSLKKSAESYYLDSMANEVVYNLGIIDYTYRECKEREINLGLDLKGGMNVTLEVQVQDVVNAMAGSNRNNPVFKKAIADALKEQQNSQEDFITIFYNVFKRENPNLPFRTFFRTQELKKQIAPDASDEEVLKVLQAQADAAIGNTYDILSKRIDQFGVSQPRIQKLQTAGRILVELPGVKDPKRVRKILQSTARLEFWETYDLKKDQLYVALSNADMVSYNYYKNLMGSAKGKSGNEKAETPAQDEDVPSFEGDDTAASDKPAADSTVADTTEENALLAAANDSLDESASTQEDTAVDISVMRLYKYLQPQFYKDNATGRMEAAAGPVVGIAAIRDTARVNTILNLPQVKAQFPRNLKFMWGVKPNKRYKGAQVLELYALKVTRRDGQPPLDGEVLTDARYDYDQTGRVEINMTMNSQGALIWKNLTRDNKKRSIAIVLDGYVYSAPTVQDEISGGRSQITGDFTIEEGKDLANVLKSGKLPVPARIIEEAVVGPSLGKEAVNAGLMSFVVAFILVLLYMWFFYSKAGIVADIALISNIFFLFGVLASLQAVLTLPGIAGIVLTLGMAVDANVIIFERIKEEVRAGKGIKLALSDGYKNAYSAIIDGNITTLLTGVVLYIFGSGPVQGFATTLIIGIITSLFSAIFISRLIFSWMLDKNMNLVFETKMTKGFLANVHFDFIGWRRKAYIISGAIIVIGLGFLFTKGLNPGIDFAGGRTYVVRFDQDVNTVKLSEALGQEFKDDKGNPMRPEVKTFGPTTQVKITTKYLIEDKRKEVDSIVDYKIYEGSKPFFKSEISEPEFFSSDENKDRGMLSSQKVDPTISDDLMWESYLAVLFAFIVIFVYIALRFRKWQYGVGGLVALVHDALIVISMYSIFTGILPFDMEVDQAFIAAILTIIGYSINDSVIIFDRIREYSGLFPKRSLYDNMNYALSSTLGRTVNTSGTTIVVLLTIFIFGGEVIRGFIFALLVGVIVGTYSSLFVASPVAYETMKKQDAERLNQTKKKKK